MSAFAGFDCSSFPGADEMSWLKANTNLSWCGFYLAPAPCHGDQGWMNQRASLVAQGWGLAPTYLGQQVTGPGSNPAKVTAQQGQIDGANAVSLMTNAGFPANSRVFLDLENGSPLRAAQSQYLVAWATAVEAGGYAVGVYCSHTIAAEVAAAYPAAQIWAFKVTSTTGPIITNPIFDTPAPSGSGYAQAMIWQYQQDSTLTLAGSPVASLMIDDDSSTVANPAQA